MFKKIDEFNVLRKLIKKPTSTQRQLAKDLNLSLGKINYCLKALNKKGLIKFRNFKNNPNKLSYTYLITPKGITEKTKLTINFMKQKMKEYDELKSELSSQDRNKISKNKDI
tara:strand:- start:199 stop:534 length:336 start_codon:yes stop_codon:yes gene_type:complete